MKSIAIYGAGSFGREVLMLIRQINESQPQWEPIGFYDDNMTTEESVHDLPILGGIKALNDLEGDLHIVIAIANPVVKKRIVKKIVNAGIKYATLIHPSVQLAPYQHITVGDGTVITAGNIMTVDIAIGNHVILNLGCTCGHDVIIGDFVSIMPNCIMFGPSTIGEGSFIGTGAAILNRVDIQPDSRIGARELVTAGQPKILQ